MRKTPTLPARGRFGAPLGFVCLIALFGGATPAGAQSVLVPADDAYLLPRGVIRLRVDALFARYSEVDGAAGRSPVGHRFAADSLGIRQLPRLAELETDVRTVSGLAAFSVSLGRTTSSAQVSSLTTPLIIEYGALSWLTFGVVVPYVRTRTEVLFDVDPRLETASIGFNRALSDGDSAAISASYVTVAQFRSASLGLASALSRCPPGSPAPECARFADPAARARAEALVAESGSFANALERVYLRSPFAPLQRGTLQLAIESRIGDFNARFASFGGGSVSARPVGAIAPAGFNDLARALEDTSALGLGVGARLRSAERSNLGDIELAAKIRLFDTFGGEQRRLRPQGLAMRAAVGGVVRLGTASEDRTDDFFDVTTGDGQTDVELRALLDVAYGRWGYATAAVRLVRQLADRSTVRSGDAAATPFPFLSSREEVERDLGDVIELELSPRLTLGDAAAVGLRYVYRSKSADKYGGGDLIPVLGAGGFSAGGAEREHRLGGTFTYSTVSAYSRGRAKYPFEISYERAQVIHSAAGPVPLAFTDRLTLRVYARGYPHAPRRQGRPSGG